MKKTTKTVALLAVLSVAAVGCQKETIAVPQTGVESSETVYTVRYVINDVTHTETLIGEQAWADFLQRMMALAEEGYRITMSRSANSALYSDSKEVVTYTTKDKKKALAWINEMMEAGYMVTFSFNPQTGEYTCIAYNFYELFN